LIPSKRMSRLRYHTIGKVGKRKAEEKGLSLEKDQREAESHSPPGGCGGRSTILFFVLMGKEEGQASEYSGKKHEPGQRERR